MCSFCLPSAGKILILVEKESCLVSLPFFCLAYTKLEVCPSMGCTLPKKIVACCETLTNVIFAHVDTVQPSL